MIKVAEILSIKKERDSLKRVQLLVDRDPCVVNTLNNDGGLPVHLFIKQFYDLSEGYKNITECLTIYLNAKPKPTSDYLTGLQKLPDDCCMCRQSTSRSSEVIYLTIYLNAKPKLTSNYLTGLQKLPDNCCVCQQSTSRLSEVILAMM